MLNLFKPNELPAAQIFKMLITHQFISKIIECLLTNTNGTSLPSADSTNPNLIYQTNAKTKNVSKPLIFDLHIFIFEAKFDLKSLIVLNKEHNL